MAQAKEMLDELKDNAPEADPFPTIRESLAELGANPDKYEKILAKTDENLHWEKVFQPKTTLEAGAITLLAAAKQSGAEPNEYLSRLAPYFDSRIQSLPDMYNASGYVSGDAPKRAVLTRTARELKGSAYTLPHELEHTLQGIDGENFLPLYGPLGSDTKRFGAYDRNKDRLQEALSKMPVEEREQITAKHPVFGRYLSRGNELFARIRAKDMLDSAKGEDFLQTEMGQKLFPTDRDRSYFIGSTLPGVPTITPPYTFESTDKNRKPLTDPNTSYARQLYNMLTAPKEYQEGGEVTDEFPEEAGVMPDQNPSEAAKRLLYYKKTAAPTPPTDIARLGKQAGLIGLGFAPGAGVADYFGKFPAVEGGTEPSAVENFQKGNYGTATLQGLGAMGDLAMAVPVAGTAIGSVMKAPRAAQKMLQELKGSRKTPTQEIPDADVILEKAKEVEGLCSFMNCKLFSQMVSGVPEITKLPRVDKAQIGDIYAWPNGTHYAVDIGKGKVIEVEEWGAAPRVSSMSNLMKELDRPEFILRPPPGTYKPKKIKESELPSEAIQALEKFPEQQAASPEKGGKVLPSSTTARDDLAKVPGVLPKAERDANLNKMLEKSVVKEPVYHSTYSDFPEFKTNFGEDEYFQFGAHVGSVDAASNRLSLKQAEDAARGAKASETGANIMPVYAKITNPLRLDENRTGRWGVDDIMSTIMEKADAGDIKGIPPNIVDDFFDDNLQIEKFLGKKVKGEPRVWQNTMDWQPGERSKLLTEFIEKLGHDGIVYNNLFEGGGDSYLVLRPTQLKSATGNKGTYDTESPVLNKAKGGEVRKPK